MKLRKLFLSVFVVTMLFSTTALAAPVQMPDGGFFDYEFYIANNPDVVAMVGTDPYALYAHYNYCGKTEGRLPYEGYDPSVTPTVATPVTLPEEAATAEVPTTPAVTAVSEYAELEQSIIATMQAYGCTATFNNPDRYSQLLANGKNINGLNNTQIVSSYLTTFKTSILGNPSSTWAAYCRNLDFANFSQEILTSERLKNIAGRGYSNITLCVISNSSGKALLMLME